MLLKEAKLLEQKLQDVIDENEALRKGMHEILDSVRCHDGKTVEVEFSNNQWKHAVNGRVYHAHQNVLSVTNCC